MKLVSVECHRSSDGKSILVQVMASCHQATSHYLNQCWLRSILPYDITWPHWVNELHFPQTVRHKTYSKSHFYSCQHWFQNNSTICIFIVELDMSTELHHVMCVNHWPTLLKPLTSLAKPSLNFNGCLAKLRLTSLIKSWKLATDISCHTGVCVQCQQMCEGLSIATCILGT